MRIVPTVCSSMPATLVVTAKWRIAPTAIRRSEVPSPMWVRTAYRAPANTATPGLLTSCNLVFMNRHQPKAIFAALLLSAMLPTYASARKDQVSVIQDDARVLSGSAREGTLDEMKTLGADVVKITIFWRDVAAEKPGNPEDPNAYPAAKWAPYDAAIQGIVSRGLQPFVDLSGGAPDWATTKSSDPPGAYRPNAAEFGKFAKAVGTRYSGSFAPGGGAGGGGGGGTPSCPPKPLPCPAPPVGEALASVTSGSPAA